MKKYQSADDFFRAFHDLVERIEHFGKPEVAQKLQYGFSCLNGLTDGWAQLMESMEQTLAQHRNELRKKDTDELEKMLQLVKTAVFRK